MYVHKPNRSEVLTTFKTHAWSADWAQSHHQMLQMAHKYQWVCAQFNFAMNVGIDIPGSHEKSRLWALKAFAHFISSLSNLLRALILICLECFCSLS